MSAYFPGCSLRATGVAYEESLLTLFRLLDLPLEELRDWNCCGATSYMSIDEESAFQLSARNLALAHKAGAWTLAALAAFHAAAAVTPANASRSVFSSRRSISGIASGVPQCRAVRSITRPSATPSVRAFSGSLSSCRVRWAPTGMRSPRAASSI